jgi:hypothetical protein
VCLSLVREAVQLLNRFPRKPDRHLAHARGGALCPACSCPVGLCLVDAFSWGHCRQFGCRVWGKVTTTITRVQRFCDWSQIATTGHKSGMAGIPAIQANQTKALISEIGASANLQSPPLLTPEMAFAPTGVDSEPATGWRTSKHLN